jgi:hypothetical protein
LLLAKATVLPHHFRARAIAGMGLAGPHDGLSGKQQYLQRRTFMRRVTAICAAAAIVASNLVVAGAAVARPMHQPLSGYYVIRWNDTGICQIWNTDLTEKPWRMFSEYKIVSKPVPTFAAAATIQENMRMSRGCTL